MGPQLSELRWRLSVYVVATFLITPAVGLLASAAFGVLDRELISSTLARGWLPAFLTLMSVWAAVHFWHFVDGLAPWLRPQADQEAARHALTRRVRDFSRDYWGLFLFYALGGPAVFALTSRVALLPEGMPVLVTLMLLQLAVAILIGLPAYLLLLDRLGALVSLTGLSRVHHGLQFRIMLLGGFVPLLAYSVLMAYYVLRTGYLSMQTLVLWAALGGVTALIAALSARSVARSLRPVQQALGRSGATTHEDLARLEPRSTDEIGYLTQTLGRLFGRLADQESHMHAVVDNAAEGVIVVDESGRIDTFNVAAERLFGYRAQEVRGRPTAWLLPALAEEGGAPRLADGEQETEGVHRDGRRLPVSARVSELKLSGKRMFICLVADIAERKAAQERQRQAEAQYRDLVETAQDLVWSVDVEGRWRYLNKAAHEIYGYAPEEMIGRPFREVQTPETAPAEDAAFARLLGGGEVVQLETVHRDRNGQERHLSFNAKAQTDDSGNVLQITGTARDITEKKAFERQLTYQAEHDALTGLHNRRYFQQELERVVARIHRSGGTCGVLYIDLDQFKYVNDTQGHAAGDRLLIEVAGMLDANVRDGELLSRFGGDEFTVLLYHIDPGALPGVAEKFLGLFETYKFFDAGKAFNVSSSIGAATITSSTANAEEALAHADLACNLAKSRGRNRVHVYAPEDADQHGMAEDMGWAARVREMLEQDRFVLLYQPITALTTGHVADFEVLMRMPCDDGEMILPGGFLPAAERFGLIQSLDRWTVRRAMEELAASDTTDNPAGLSVNLSGQAFEDPSLLPLIRDQLARTGLEPSRLTFEITETAAITNLARAVEFIGALKEIGCRFSLDDFGSGFCSFTYLKHLPVDILKIDGAFVHGLSESSVDQAMVRSMNQIAHALGKVTVAECVEDQETLKLLREMGVDYAQGNFISPPGKRPEINPPGAEVLREIESREVRTED